MARLLFRDSQGREGTVELSPTEAVFVGRGLECAIRTDDGMVSRRHSRILLESGRFVVEDLDSSNGTHVNNVRIKRQALGHADVIQCGSLMIRFIDDGSGNAVQQPVGPQPSPAKKGGTMVLERPPERGIERGIERGVERATDLPPFGNQAASAAGYGSPASSYSQGTSPGPLGPPYGQPVGSPLGSPLGPQAGIGATQVPSPYGGPPQMPSPIPSGGQGSHVGQGANSPYGAPRVGAFGGSVASQSNAGPYGGPPAMPMGAPPVPAAAKAGPPGMPYGGPPPGYPPNPPIYASNPPAPATVGINAARLGDNPSMFAQGAPLGKVPPPHAPRTADEAAEDKVLVDLGLEFDAGKAEAEIKSLRSQLDKATANYEREVADGKRIRAESAAVRDKNEDLKAQIKDRDDQVAAHDRVADELRDELQQTRNELGRLRNELGDMAENVAARERQAARALEDTSKLRDDIEDKNRQLMELSRTKDEGWKKLNEQLTEIEHLREVINEQERMLEERRVGLISQEEVIKELRGEKEKTLKLVAQLRAERDEAKTNSSRAAAQIAGLEEENRRIGRLLVEAQTDPGRGGSGGQTDHLMKMTGDIRELRVELKKVESDRDRLQEQYSRADVDREKLEGRLAQIEVELQEAMHGKIAAESARNVAQDALAKAEVARHKAAEEALTAAKARDLASTGGDDARRELDRMRKRLAEVEKAPAQAAPSAEKTKDLQLEREASERKLKEANDRAAAAERSLKALQAEVDAAKTDAAKARAEAARTKAAADAQAQSTSENTVTSAPPLEIELAKTANEVYASINDILSEMRNNTRLVQGELSKVTADSDTLHAISAAVEALVDNAETAKGALRGLRDIANG